MSLTDSIISFINEYYIMPIVQDSGYNIVNTLTWALILVVCVYGIIYAFNKLKIQIDERFFYALLPFILSGSALRVVADASIISAPFVYLLITPNIYFLMFLGTAALLLISFAFEKLKIVSDFKKIFFAFGILCLLFLLSILLINCEIVNLRVLFAVLTGGIVWTLIFYGIFYLFKAKRHITPLNSAIIFSHMADATSTIIGIEFLGYYEKHVIPSYFIDLTGTALVMYPLKLLIIILLIWSFDSIKYHFENEENGNVNEKNSLSKDILSQNKTDLLLNSLKIVIIILGLAPAVRNTLRMLFGI